MSKLLNQLKIFLRCKYIWNLPGKSRVLIYDACENWYITQYFTEWQPEILHVRGEVIYVLVFLRSLFVRGSRKTAYIDCYIKIVNPDIVVTFIDNNSTFYSIANRHKQLKTLFIQNGWRGYYADIFEIFDKLSPDSLGEFKVDYMLTFGSVTGSKYSRYISGDVIPIGSVKSNSCDISVSKMADSISFVSQWHKEGFDMGGIFYTHDEFFTQADRPVLKSVENYCREYDKNLFVIPRYSKNEELRELEEAYYKDLLTIDHEYYELQTEYSTYQAMDASEVVVTVDSTMGYESIARGNKTAIFPIRSSLTGVPGLTYGWPGDYPSEGVFWSNKCDEKIFIRILDYLFSVNDRQWKVDVADSGFSSLMAYDPGNTILKKTIESELGAVPLPASV